MLTILIIVCVLQSVHASWWYLGISSAYQSTPEEFQALSRTREERCKDLKFFSDRQQDVCSRDERLLRAITEGAAIAILECQHQFRERRWNCSTVNSTNVFGEVISIKSRETAYIYAILSSGIMHSVTRACANGNLVHCGCDIRVRHKDTRDAFEWGGCSDDVRYGTRFSREFIDSNETNHNDAGMMNLWNNEAGRRIIKSSMDLICKCHGVSGSCSIKICWRRMKNFRLVGSKLHEKFDGASRVKFNMRKKKLRPLNLRQKRPTKKDLVYLQESPDFCEFSPDSGSLGTHGRQCNKTSYGLDGCILMCCGRGYYTMVREITDDCDCKFHWCCRVECKKCKQIIEMHFCN